MFIKKLINKIRLNKNNRPIVNFAKKIMPTLSSKEVLSREDFLSQAIFYKKQLIEANSGDQVRNLWRSTNIPYKILEQDPYSLNYRNEILKLYQDLTNTTYDTNNEMTSTKQSAEEFEIGYPWMSMDLEIIAQEIAKPVQIMRLLKKFKGANTKAIEFGSGWGNLSIPLAKAGCSMTVVDIDRGFIERLLRIADREKLDIDYRIGDFIEIAKTERNKFDAVIFQSSFHHCLDFDKLISLIVKNLLNEDGCIIFVNEPITDDLLFPWGLRYDGESLWAIMCNQWLELGFQRDFFIGMLLNNGMLPSKVEAIPNLIGEGFVARNGNLGINFKELILPKLHDLTFHEREDAASGRFCKQRSTLPRIKNYGSKYKLEFINYGVKPISFNVQSESVLVPARLSSGEVKIIEIRADGHDVVIQSDIFIPNIDRKNGDTRNLGIYLSRVMIEVNIF